MRRMNRQLFRRNARLVGSLILLFLFLWIVVSVFILTNLSSSSSSSSSASASASASASVSASASASASVATKLDHQQQQQQQQPLAIVVGLPKSGTTSLYQFFSCSGFPTTHYCCCGSNATQYPCTGGRMMAEQLQDNLASSNNSNSNSDARSLLWRLGTPEVHKNHPNDENLNLNLNLNLNQNQNQNQNQYQYQNQAGVIHTQLDGETKDGSFYFLPQHHLLSELDQAAPNAIWILPLRPALDWKRSVQGWLDLEDRLRRNYYYVNSASSSKQQQKSKDRIQITDEEEDFLVEFYQLHTRKIREYCHQHRRLRDHCIEVEIDDANAGNQLIKQFPGTRAECWDRHNSGPFFQALPPPPKR